MSDVRSPDEAIAAAVDTRRPPNWLRAFLRYPSSYVGVGILALWGVAAAFGELLTPYSPYDVTAGAPLEAPGPAHWFGTDTLGRDLFSRVIVGARSILGISLAAAIIAVLLGTLIGLLMGYYRGWVDSVLSRTSEAIMALPSVILALLAISALGASSLTLVLVVGFAFSWVVARTVRAAVLREAQADYVKAALMRDESHAYILWAEIAPNIVGVIIVEFTIRVAFAIFSVASLSFLGFGVQPPTPDWGLIVSESYTLLPAGYWWPTVFPCLAIASLVIAIQIVVENLERGARS